MLMGLPSIHPDARVGHVHLKVSDLDRSLAFYRFVFASDLIQLVPDQLAFVSAGGYHHHLALNVIESRGGTPPPRHHTGLVHVAFVYPSRRELARAYERVRQHGITDAR